MATTSNFGWTTTGLSASNNPPADLGSLAAQVDASLRVVTTPPLLKLWQTADVSVPTETDKALTCSSLHVLGGWGTGSGSWARTAPRSGYYRLAAQAQLAPAASGYGRIAIYVDGVIVGLGWLPLHSVSRLTVGCEAELWIDSGAEVSFKVYQTSGADLTSYGGEPYRTWMSAQYLRAS